MKRVRSQRSQSYKSKSKTLRLREKLSASWKKFIEWSIEKPYLDFFFDNFLTIIFLSLLLSVFFLTFEASIIGLISLAIKAIREKNPVVAAIFTSLLAFFGVFIAAAIPAWINSKNKTDRTSRKVETSTQMVSYYEDIYKIIEKPRYYHFEKISNFLDKFDDKVGIYGSNDIKRKWLKFQLKEKILKTQENPTSADIDDVLHFTNFLQAIRKEMGYESNNALWRITYKDLKSKYIKQDNSLSIKKSEVALARNSTNSTSESDQKDFQAAWARWFDEVEQLEPESPQLKSNEYRQALIDKYRKQGLDL